MGKEAGNTRRTDNKITTKKRKSSRTINKTRQEIPQPKQEELTTKQVRKINSYLTIKVKQF